MSTLQEAPGLNFDTTKHIEKKKFISQVKEEAANLASLGGIGVSLAATIEILKNFDFFNLVESITSPTTLVNDGLSLVGFGIIMAAHHVAEKSKADVKYYSELLKSDNATLK